MDVTTLLPSDYISYLTTFFPNTLDALGSSKLMYYEKGINFAKNISSYVISALAILLLNYLIYLVFSLVPLDKTHKIAHNLKRRKLITIHDVLEQLILPITLFGVSQLGYILYNLKLYWVYFLAFIFVLGFIASPLIFSVWAYLHRKDS